MQPGDTTTIKNFMFYRGDTFSFGLEFVGLERDLSEAYLTIRKTKNSTILLQKTLDNGIAKIETGKYRIRVAPEDTQNWIPGSYVYDVEVVIDDDVKTILSGSFNILMDVTY
jgi:hypothetical protein